eukprot:TRINITY_DN1862_c0_g1_i2.p1 TRINITY_DN1862_c0_g1~~TRINITY_DN1862_c0_g1_i2.p1  ORF type:complete len:394 (+),score=104.00 TRINITY_DN1862_c0_g1_i2:123-1304(+)
MASNLPKITKPLHPLDPLSREEIALAVSLVRNRFEKDGEKPSFCRVGLKEPHKDLILFYDSAPVDNKPKIPREAFASVLVRSKAKTYEVVLSLDDIEPHMVSKNHMVGVQPLLLANEYQEVENLIQNDPVVAEILKKRFGIEDMSKVHVDLWIGFFSNPRNRIAKPLLFYKEEKNANIYARPIDGVEIDVDMNSMRVLDVKELFEVPIPPSNPLSTYEGITNYRPGRKPINVSQPEGPSYTVKGRLVEWQNWSFRVGFTGWEGLVLHQIGYYDRDKDIRRPVIFRASCAEMVVPYGDPRHPNYLKNAFDAGEDGLGRNANSLEMGCDCKGDIHYFDVDLCDAKGEFYCIKNAICLHEEDYGILWKHKDWRTQKGEVRRARRLVISFFYNNCQL